MLQDRQQPGRAPSRMVTAELDHVGPARGRLGVQRCRRGVVARPERFQAAPAQAPAEGADGPRRHTVGCGEGDRGLAAAVPLAELLADGDGYGAGHAESSQGRPRYPLPVVAAGVGRHNLPSQLPGTTYRRVTESGRYLPRPGRRGFSRSSRVCSAGSSCRRRMSRAGWSAPHTRPERQRTSATPATALSAVGD